MSNRFGSLGQRALRLVVLAIAFCVAGVEAQAFEPTPGDAVEVREGDIWSPAEFLKKEGRRHQIRYDDGTEEWVTADRLRAVGGAGRSASEPVRDKPRRFRQGQEVELKKFNKWIAAEIKRASPPLYLVATKEGIGEKQFHWEWVDADRIREAGEDHEGPDTRSQFGHRVGNDSIRESRREAEEAYADHQLKESQTARDATGKRDPFGPPPFAHPVTNADRSQMQNVAVGGGAWGEPVVDPGEPIPGPIRHLSIESKATVGSFFARPQVIDATGRFALVVIRDQEPGKADYLYVERFDLARGRSESAAGFDAASLPLAISPDGQRLAGHANGFHIGSKTRLDVWDWSGREPVHQLSFEPHRSDRRGQGDIESIAFADQDTVVVHVRSGAVSAWDAATGRGLWELAPPRGGSSAMAVSPGGSVVAVVGQDEVWLLDAATGRVRATLPGPGMRPARVSFSQDGQTLAVAADDRIQAWDLAGRRAFPAVAVAPSSMSASGGGLLVLDGGTVVWRGQTFDPSTGAKGAGYVWAGGLAHGHGPRLLGMNRALKDEARAFNVWAFPAPQAERLKLATAALILKEGGVVRIDTSRLEGDADLRRQVTQALTEAVSARGLIVDPDAPVVFLAETTTRSQMQVYESNELFPMDRTQSNLRVDTKVTRLAIEAAGETAWQRVRSVSSSDRVELAEGQSAQSALDASVDRDAGARFILKLMGGQESIPAIIPDPRGAQAPQWQLDPGGFGRIAP